LLLRKVLWLLATLAVSLPAVAGSTSASLSVNIALTSPPTGVCTSALLSDGTGAIVRVSCQTGEVVSISPRPGGLFVDTHGGAYTYHVASGSTSGPVAAGFAVDVTDRAPGNTAFRVNSVEQSDGSLEVLVSF
jgi:hypothetical protein